MSDITDRIADVIAEALRGELHQLYAEEPRGQARERIGRVAAIAVVAELGLREEEVVDFTGGAEIRYVTKTYPLF